VSGTGGPRHARARRRGRGALHAIRRRLGGRAARALLLAPLMLIALGAAALHAQRPGDGRVLAVRLEGAVTPVMAEVLDHALDRAEREGYTAMVVEIDTPGGLETSMREMVKRILAAEVPVITWVSPSGARAASAGVFITMAADVAAMAPGTNMGAATPINMQGPMDSTLARKAANDASAFARTIAAQRGRNAVWAERAVREAVSASEAEAVELDIIDFIAGTREELLQKADGLPWRRGDETRTLAVAGLQQDQAEPSFRQKVLGVLADPNIAYILLMMGFYGLLFELQNPGAILPGIVGGICIILAFLALSALPVNFAGIALILLGVVFFIAEIKVLSHGLLAAGGIVSVALGSLILFKGEGVRLSWSVIAGGTVATAAFFLFIAGAALRARGRRVVTGSEGMIGMRAVVIAPLAPRGTVRVGDELWTAVAEAGAAVGTEVEITGVEQLTLRVRPVAKEAQA
jgi:membrane-bound serine protease (ClpP class)